MRSMATRSAGSRIISAAATQAIAFFRYDSRAGMSFPPAERTKNDRVPGACDDAANRDGPKERSPGIGTQHRGLPACRPSDTAGCGRLAVRTYLSRKPATKAFKNRPLGAEPGQPPVLADLGR